MKSNKNWQQPSTKRATPKKGFSKLFRGKMIRYRTRISEFEDDTPSSTVVRLILVVLSLQLLVIGGVWLRGELKKSHSVETVSIPAKSISSSSEFSTPQVIEPDETPLITGKDQLVDAPVVAKVVETGASSQPVEAGPARHIVATGDTWETIARDNSCTIADLKFLNTGASLVSGTTLVIPMKAEERAIIAKQKKEEEIRIAGETYILKSGDTLSKIARKNKISVAKLQQYNNITDPRKLKIGQAIRIPGK